MALVRIGEVTNYCVPPYTSLVVSLLVMEIWFKMDRFNTVNMFNPGFADKDPTQVNSILSSSSKQCQAQPSSS